VTERDDDETELNRCRMCDRLWPDLPCLTCGACFHCASDDCDRCVRRIEFLRSEAAPPRPVAEPAPSPAPEVARLRELLAFSERDRWEVAPYGDGEHGVFRLPSGAPDDSGDIICRAYSRRDAELIAELRNALPALLAVAEALVQARETLLHWEASTVIPADFDNTLATANTALAALQKGRP
jgi:hypothetical protein